MIIGFVVIFCSACLGIFIATDISDNFIRHSEDLNSWYNTLRRSAHGHFNLFGIIHILFGLTLPYSIWSFAVKRWQTYFLAFGTLAMGPGLWIRAMVEPSDQIDGVGIILGLFISLALITMISHAAGILGKYNRIKS